MPLGSRLITVTTVGRSSFTTSTMTSLAGPGMTLSGAAVGSGPVPVGVSVGGAVRAVVATYPPAVAPAAPRMMPMTRRAAPPMPDRRGGCGGTGVAS